MSPRPPVSRTHPPFVSSEVGKRQRRRFSTSLETNGHKASTQTGFTLVELMVVITVIALVAAAVVVTAPDPRGRLADAGETFAARAVAIRDDAVVSGRATAVRITSAGYAFDREADGRWAPAGDAPFDSAAWGGGIRADLGSGGGARVAFDPTGMVSDPVAFTLVRDGERLGITVGADGRIRVGG